MGKLLTSLARWAKMSELDSTANNKNNDNRVTVSKEPCKLKNIKEKGLNSWL